MSSIDPPTIIVGNNYSKLLIPSGTEFYYQPMLKEIDDALSFDVQGKEFIDVYNKIGKDGRPLWDGKKHLINLTGLPLKRIAWKRYVTEPNLFLTGNLMQVLKIMHRFDVKPSLIPSEERLESNQGETISLGWNDNFKIRDYQRECIDVAINNQRGLLQIATGGGKTVIAAKLIQELGVAPTLFLVTTKDLLYQAYDRFNQALSGVGIGIVGDGKCDINKDNKIYVATIQTIIRAIATQDQYNASLKSLSAFMEDSFSKEDDLDTSNIDKIKGLLNEVRLIIFDECQHAPAETCRLTIMQCPKALYRYGLSATPFREDGEDLTIEGLFGPCLINVSSSFLIKNKYLVSPEITLIDFRKNHKLKQTYAKEYKEEIVENSIRNKICAAFAKTFADEDKTILILVKQINHGKEITNALSEQELDDISFFIDGTKSSKVRNESLEKLRQGKIKILVATTLADEGLDIPNLDVLILAGGGKSKSRALQRIGRVLRTHQNKDKGIVIDFLDSGHHCRSHSLTRKKIYLSEEAFKVDTIDINDILQYVSIPHDNKYII